MINRILDVIYIGAKIFSTERARYYRNKVYDLQQTIARVEDSDFYNKDMEEKGKAERELHYRLQALEKEFKEEAKKEGFI